MELWNYAIMETQKCKIQTTIAITGYMFQQIA